VLTFANLWPVTLHVPQLPLAHSSRRQFFKNGSAFCTTETLNDHMLLCTVDMAKELKDREVRLR